MSDKPKRFSHLEFGERFRKQLKERQLEEKDIEEDLCKELDVSASVFRQWANGHTLPTCEKLYKLSKYFNVSTDYLLGISDYPLPMPGIGDQNKGLDESIKNSLSESFANALYYISLLPPQEEQAAAADRLYGLISSFQRMIMQSLEMRVGSRDLFRNFILFSSRYEEGQEQLRDHRETLIQLTLQKMKDPAKLQELLYGAPNE